MTLRQELAALLEERTLPNWERRKRRLERLSPGRIYTSVSKARKGEPLTLEEYVVSHLGFLPGERERLEQRKAEEAAKIGSPDASMNGDP